jgi:NAD(P)H-dependent FMN reductase
LPHYNPNETSFPENAKIIAKMMQESHLWLISAPEYNYSIPGSLKDLIDYVSRAPHNKPNIGNFTDKVVGLMSASPSIWGGIRGLRHMREILSALGSLVVAPQVNITNAFSAFDQAGELIDQPNKDAVKTMLDKAINLAIKLNS